MRISELCNLKRSQIDKSGRIFITGKGKKQRFVYLTPRARQHLEAYVNTRKDNCPASFIPYAGKNVVNPKKESFTDYLQGKIKRCMRRLRYMGNTRGMISNDINLL
jgi:integrase